jgi:hypothetical protein
MGDQDLPDHLGGEFSGLGGGVAEMNASFESVFECSLAASTRVDLRFDDKLSAAQRGCHGLGFRWSVGDPSGLGGDTEFCKKFASLKFVDIHGKKGIRLTNTRPLFEGKAIPAKRREKMPEWHFSRGGECRQEGAKSVRDCF